mmetsp:Transcript_20363/g.47301  ORF Transcript_20363/g.47301 Transcript_20363/m.47301 type:complete len:201 (-) Transcript_20363:1232-1834(-)
MPPAAMPPAASDSQMATRRESFVTAWPTSARLTSPEGSSGEMPCLERRPSMRSWRRETSLSSVCTLADWFAVSTSAFCMAPICRFTAWAHSAKSGPLPSAGGGGSGLLMTAASAAPTSALTAGLVSARMAPPYEPPKPSSAAARVAWCTAASARSASSSSVSGSPGPPSSPIPSTPTFSFLSCSAMITSAFSASHVCAAS